MIVDRAITIPIPAKEAFVRVTDIPFVGACLPGASDVREAGEGTYAGTFSVKVGPVTVSLDGTVSFVDIDDEARRAVLRLDAADRRIGGNVAGEMVLQVEEAGDESRLVVHTEVTISGKLGQFGQAVILKKADQITEAFVAEFSRRVIEDNEFEAQVRAAASVGQPPGAVSGSAGAAPSATVPSRHPDAAQAAQNLEAIVGMLRRGRELSMVNSAIDLGHGSGRQGAGHLWIGLKAIEAGLTGDELGSRPYIISVQLAGAEDVNAAWTEVCKVGLDRPVAVAVVPGGRALADLGILAAGLRDLSVRAGRPVIPVATTPWTLMSYLELAAAGRVPALAVDTGIHLGRDMSVLTRAAIAELRRAGVQTPIIAGPVRTAQEGGRLRDSGADAVLRTKEESRTKRLTGAVRSQLGRAART